MKKNREPDHVHGPDCHHDNDSDHTAHNAHGVAQPYRREEPKLGRNDQCPCGSGKKFKKCHGTAAA
jgi:uncharacterized protein YchJ